MRPTKYVWNCWSSNPRSTKGVWERQAPNMLEPAPVRKAVVCREVNQRSAEDDDFVEKLLQKADADRAPLPLPPLTEVSDMEVDDEDLFDEPTSSTKAALPEKQNESRSQRGMYTEADLKKDIEKLNLAAQSLTETRTKFENIWKWFDSQEETDDRVPEKSSQTEREESNQDQAELNDISDLWKLSSSDDEN